MPTPAAPATPPAAPSAKPEVVLQVGGEGGSVVLKRVRSSEGAWVFFLGKDEPGLQKALKALAAGAFDLKAEPRLAGSFEQAMKLLDRTGWPNLSPEVVHAQYRELIWGRAVTRLGSSSPRLKAWRVVCGT